MCGSFIFLSHLGARRRASVVMRALSGTWSPSWSSIDCHNALHDCLRHKHYGGWRVGVGMGMAWGGRIVFERRLMCKTQEKTKPRAPRFRVSDRCCAFLPLWRQKLLRQRLGLGERKVGGVGKEGKDQRHSGVETIPPSLRSGVCPATLSPPCRCPVLVTNEIRSLVDTRPVSSV